MAETCRILYPWAMIVNKATSAVKGRPVYAGIPRCMPKGGCPRGRSRESSRGRRRRAMVRYSGIGLQATFRDPSCGDSD